MEIGKISDQEFLDAVRNNDYKKWNRDELKKALKDPRRIDAVRQLVADEDRKFCLKLIDSKDSLDVLLFQSLARSIIRKNPEEFVQPLLGQLTIGTNKKM